MAYVHGRNTNHIPTMINRFLIQVGDLAYTKSKTKLELILLS